MRSLLSSVLVVSLIAAAHADDWPQWRGINRDGKSAETGLLKTWPAEGPKLVTTIADIGKGWSSPTVVGGRVYATGMISNNLVAFCFSEDGKKLWNKILGPEFTENFPGTRAQPTVDKGRLYILSGKGRLTALDTATGNEVWKLEYAERFKGTAPKHGFAESVLIDGDRLICTPGGSDGAIAALNKQTGETIWTSKGTKGGALYCSLIAFECGGIRQYANTIGGALVGVRADTGASLWSYKRPAFYRSANTAVYGNNCIFAANGMGTGGGAAKLEAKGGAVTATPMWETKDMDCEVGGYVLVDGYIYGNNKKGWACLSLASGQVKWNVQPKTPPGVGKGSVIYADGMLYTLCEDGIMGLAEANPNEYKPVSSFKLPAVEAAAKPSAKPSAKAETAGRSQSGSNATAKINFEERAMLESVSHDTWAHPVISGGKLFLRSADKLFVYAIKKQP